MQRLLVSSYSMAKHLAAETVLSSQAFQDHQTKVDMTWHCLPASANSSTHAFTRTGYCHIVYTTVEQLTYSGTVQTR